MDNLYEIFGSDTNLSVYSDNGNFCFELYENHKHADYFIMTSPYLP